MTRLILPVAALIALCACDPTTPTGGQDTDVVDVDTDTTVEAECQTIWA